MSLAAGIQSSGWGVGTLVRARSREWVVLTGSNAELLHVRPVSGSEEDRTVIDVLLETEPVVNAAFAPPQLHQVSSHDAALILRDALMLTLRRGAGPFRGLGQIAVEPRAYQLVPLMMALRLETVRLLIADDVGIGKTIEAALIIRELFDRGEIQRFAILCPPHLVEQWQNELESRFHFRPVAVTAASASRLERDIPASSSIFMAHPHTVVSLDYIKSERKRAEFLRACPEFVVVDEAHACAGGGGGRHQRFELLKGLAANVSRHMLMLTATPHSGDDEAFYRLLSLLDAEFLALAEGGNARPDLREKLAKHFVQRRRPDIAEWQERKSLFPSRETTELTYTLTGTWERFFENVLDYCASVVSSAGSDERKQRLSFWGTLALMRCVSSSPQAAINALRTRAHAEIDGETSDLADNIFDGTADVLKEDDLEPYVGESDALSALIVQAQALTGQGGDPKLKLLTDHLTVLVKEGYSPVIFCRYIATAHYLGEHLRLKFKEHEIDVITGELSGSDRRDRIIRMGNAEKRILVATDCLSEGVNLQDSFDAVVHYDLSWNPTRHEQREGRVDRFGQKRSTVRATLIYGANNPVDGAVLEVILRKAERIRRELGVPVPLPDDGHTLTQALMKAVLLRNRAPKEEPRQAAFEFATLPEAQQIDARWQDLADKAKKNRTVFAQRRLKPEDVLPEWQKSLAALGDQHAVKRFASRALARLSAPIETLSSGFKVSLKTLAPEIQERLESEGLHGTFKLDFSYPPAANCRFIHRTHPLISTLAESLLERSLVDSTSAEGKDLGYLGRVGCWVSSGVQLPTVVVLLRLRHQLATQRSGQTTTTLVEESTALAWNQDESLHDEAAFKLLDPEPVADVAPVTRDRFIQRALDELPSRTHEISAFAQARAQALLSDHRRVREASDAKGTYSVRAILPADVIALFVLMPRQDD
jgi:superfamily II DNA or RNA helicase